MTASIRQVKPAFCIAVVLLHLALLWLFTRPLPAPAVRDDRVWLQLLWHQPPAPQSLPAPARPVARRSASTPKPQPEREPGPAAAAAVAPLPAPAATADSAEERALLADPAVADAPPAGAKELALRAVAAVDRQLRAEHGDSPATPQATAGDRLAQAFATAHAAVKPKWYEAARVELVSAPNDPKRIYRVTTAAGEYCVYYPDKAGISANSNPKSGWASFGQPTMAGCPTPF